MLSGPGLPCFHSGSAWQHPHSQKLILHAITWLALTRSLAWPSLLPCCIEWLLHDVMRPNKNDDTFSRSLPASKADKCCEHPLCSNSMQTCSQVALICIYSTYDTIMYVRVCVYTYICMSNNTCMVVTHACIPCVSSTMQSFRAKTCMTQPADPEDE